jgi:Lrp/AsnC family transcriptional regulator, leucine-responsive regulatory protein
LVGKKATTFGQKGALENGFRVALNNRYDPENNSSIALYYKNMKDSSMKGKLDKINLKMLRLLQSDGRLTNADLAQMVAVSPATCHRRISRLFEEGYIVHVRAVIAPAKVDRGALVMVGVVLDRSTPDSFATFEEAIAKLNFILDCHLVAGDFDYFLKIRVRDMADFNRIHGDQLIGLPGVRQTRTFFVMKEVVDNAPLDF